MNPHRIGSAMNFALLLVILASCFFGQLASAQYTKFPGFYTRTSCTGAACSNVAGDIAVYADEPSAGQGTLQIIPTAQIKTTASVTYIPVSATYGISGSYNAFTATISANGNSLVCTGTIDTSQALSTFSMTCTLSGTTVLTSAYTCVSGFCKTLTGTYSPIVTAGSYSVNVINKYNMDDIFYSYYDVLSNRPTNSAFNYALQVSTGMISFKDMSLSLRNNGDIQGILKVPGTNTVAGYCVGSYNSADHTMELYCTPGSSSNGLAYLQLKCNTGVCSNPASAYGERFTGLYERSYCDGIACGNLDTKMAVISSQFADTPHTGGTLIVIPATFAGVQGTTPFVAQGSFDSNNGFSVSFTMSGNSVQCKSIGSLEDTTSTAWFSFSCTMGSTTVVTRALYNCVSGMCKALSSQSTSLKMNGSYSKKSETTYNMFSFDAGYLIANQTAVSIPYFPYLTVAAQTMPSVNSLAPYFILLSRSDGALFGYIVSAAGTNALGFCEGTFDPATALLSLYCTKQDISGIAYLEYQCNAGECAKNTPDNTHNTSGAVVAASSGFVGAVMAALIALTAIMFF